MKDRWPILSGIVCVIMSSFLISGCAVNLYKQNPKSQEKIKTLQSKVDKLEALRLKEEIKFEEVRKMLERKLKRQISDKDVTLSMRDEGLAIVLSDNILFDSGKAKLKKEAFPVLDNVAAIIKGEVPDKNIGVGGHTDNVPIQYSNWKSNWELSAARATNVLYYLEEKGVSPRRLSATGYGEYRPVTLNKTSQERAGNRRVEIIILPEYGRKPVLKGEESAIK
ncbi:MAG: OmpA family protein [Candidatus Omnitrophica bacterium]|nr:OmpA family protein [Candidatus Omnitrophota bacterium]MBU1127674.1 OmpA family protein [Candidatus Omnitrophota bacterium]MBU1784705.1 OmpA family protein [Candidatus Omnitrophota bacterium]MBU1851463.1 OmpA family protein [Candidatus Omnitrophota bacterium]